MKQTSVPTCLPTPPQPEYMEVRAASEKSQTELYGKTLEQQINKNQISTHLSTAFQPEYMEVLPVSDEPQTERVQQNMTKKHSFINLSTPSQTEDLDIQPVPREQLKLNEVCSTPSITIGQKLGDQQEIVQNEAYGLRQTYYLPTELDFELLNSTRVYIPE